MTAALFSKSWLKPFSEMTEKERIDASLCVMIRMRGANQYWGSAWEKGRTCFNYLKGQIFNSDELAEIENAEKVAVQTPRGKTPMDAFMGTVMDSLRSGVVVARGGEDAEGKDVITTALLAVAQANNLKHVASMTARDTQVSSVPCWMWIEPYDPRNPEQPGIAWEKEDWDAVIPDPRWSDPQLRNLEWAIRPRRMSLDEIERRFDASEALARVMGQIAQIQGSSYGTVEQRTQAVEQAKNGQTLYTQEGQLLVAEMTHWVHMEVTSWYCPMTGAHGPVPAKSPQELQDFIESNPSYQIRRSVERILWVTTTTLTGVLLDNGPHWNQSGVFPGVPCIPDRIDSQWAGIFEFSMDLQKLGAYADTEWVHSVRTLSNNLWMMRKGAVADIEEFKKQIVLPNGVIEMGEGRNLDEIKRLDNIREQRAYLEIVERAQAEIEGLLVERNFQGGAQSSQESNKVVETRIRQVLSRLAPQIHGIHEFWLALHRTTVKSLRFAVPEGHVFRYLDPENGVREAPVNIPVEWDVMGNVKRVWNSLQESDFDYVEAQADDSVTGQEHERALYREFLETQANFPPEVVEQMALSYPSRSVQEFGRRLKEQREAKAQQPPPGPDARASLSISGQDLGMALAQKAAAKAGFIDAQDVEDSDQMQLPEDPGGATIPEGAAPALEEQLA